MRFVVVRIVLMSRDSDLRDFFSGRCGVRLSTIVADERS